MTEKIKHPRQMAENFIKGLQSFGKPISRLLISLLIVMILGITISLPAHAEARCTCTCYCEKSAPLPIFDPERVRLGITPTGWSNSDDLTIDLNPPISYKQIISEIALSGFKGLQGAPKFPSSVEGLKRDLEVRGLTISEPWVGTYFTIGNEQESKEIFNEQMEFMQNFDSNVIVIAELGGAVHQQPIDPLNSRPIFNTQEWKQLTDGLNDLGKKASENNMMLCYHPHVGTGVETIDDIHRLMKNTNDDVKLLIDTGHLYYAGASQDQILDLIEEYGPRIKHVHLKNIRQDVLDDVLESHDQTKPMSFLDSIRSGVFTVPGDKNGVLDFDAILKKLSDVNYEGWLMVEAEQDPRNEEFCPCPFVPAVTPLEPPCEPLDYAQTAGRYLNQFFNY
ncbi:MAG: TIM barrel protein [Trichodesmium sp. MAG_R04]|nr:TIM barrel protein [Trichodesmium sp. MAG_R04]